MMSVLLAITSAPTPATTSLDLTSARVLPDSLSRIHTHAEMWTSVQLESINVTSLQEPPAETQRAPTPVCVRTATK